MSLSEGVDYLTGPVSYTLVSVVGFAVLLYWRRFFVQPQVAWAMLNLSLLIAGWALTDPNFRSIVAKEDNVPITMLIYSRRLLHLAGPRTAPCRTTTAWPAASRSSKSSTTKRCWSGPIWSTPS